MKMWSVIVHMIVFGFVNQERLLVGTIYVTAVERNGNGIIINDMNKEIERRWL
jgi:hypothetical protein